MNIFLSIGFNISMHGSRGGTWGPDPPEKSKSIGCLGNTGLNPLKNRKATKPASQVGHHGPASETPNGVLPGGQ